ncbi:MAG: hypothetical protein L0287_16425 [Anaerolineae bacterium]|nr:hypothetical protein [Anaerolineae bacterium]
MAIMIFIGLIAAYAYVYFIQPFPSFWNDLASNVISEIASLASAVAATMVWAYYEKTDSPRRIWSYFAFGLWLWFAGEIAWGYLNMTVGEVAVGIPDSFWIIAYFFIGQSLLQQYRILFRPTMRELFGRAVVIVTSVFALTLLVFLFFRPIVESSSQLETIINAFYPSADLVLALAALWLARSFQGGALGRPWIGLLVFTFSDWINAWLQLSGVYAWSLEQGNLLSALSDILYVAAYLALAYGAFSKWLFLKYGLRPTT